MSTPVSSANSSYYDPNAQFTPVDGSPPAAASSEAAAPREVSIPPVTITGDAGAKQLVQQHDAARPQPDCSIEGANAAVSCGKAGLAAANAVLKGSSVVGKAVALATTVAEGISCAKDLLAYRDCKNQ